MKKYHIIFIISLFISCSKTDEKIDLYSIDLLKDNISSIDNQLKLNQQLNNQALENNFTLEIKDIRNSIIKKHSQSEIKNKLSAFRKNILKYQYFNDEYYKTKLTHILYLKNPSLLRDLYLIEIAYKNKELEFQNSIFFNKFSKEKIIYYKPNRNELIIGKISFNENSKDFIMLYDLKNNNKTLLDTIYSKNGTFKTKVDPIIDSVEIVFNFYNSLTNEFNVVDEKFSIK